VLDPFIGSGSTAVAAVESGRHYVGYDTNAGYLEMARGRIAEARGIGLSSQPRTPESVEYPGR
jgi:site-specific DNA-methyltransferase (adenine-specific)